jgi:hypothetical protein
MQGPARVRAKKEAQSHISCSRECKRVRGNELSHSQVNSYFGNWSPKWIFKFSKDNCRGQNSLNGGVLYIIGNLLEHRCLKWVHMTHLDIWDTSYGQKKGRKSNWQFDSRPLKIRNRPNFLACRWRATYFLKALDEGYNFSLDLISIRGLHTKLWVPKIAGVPTLRISGLPLGSLRKNVI